MHTGLLHFRRPLLCRRRGKNPLAFRIRGIRFRFGVSEGNENPRYARTQSTDKAANARMARINRNRGNLRLLRRICQPLRDYRMQPQDGELRPAAKPPCLPRLQPLAFSPLVRKFASSSCGLLFTMTPAGLCQHPASWPCRSASAEQSCNLTSYSKVLSVRRGNFLTGWRTGENSPPGAFRIFNLGCGDFTFDETAESSGFCASGDPSPIFVRENGISRRKITLSPPYAGRFCRFFKSSKSIGLRRLENLKGFQPAVGDDKSTKGLPPARFS